MADPAESPQPSIRRLAAFSIRPRRDLGQNFLIDSNILGVIERGAELGPEDVVLEVGGGLGVLSEHLAAVAGHTHVVEVDSDLEAPLREALEPFADRVTLHMQDALMLDYPALDPQPTKVVANLPYNIAATVLLDTVFELPQVELWIGMVQKEVGERFAAKPGTGAYGIPSVLAQLSCEVDVYRQISRRVFHPVPNVDSVLVRMRRTGPAPPVELRDFVQGAFAHRRKAMAGSLQLHSKRPGMRDAVRAALAAAGLPEDVRAERLTPEQFREVFAAVTSE